MQGIHGVVGQLSGIRPRHGAGVQSRLQKFWAGAGWLGRRVDATQGETIASLVVSVVFCQEQSGAGCQSDKERESEGKAMHGRRSESGGQEKNMGQAASFICVEAAERQAGLSLIRAETRERRLACEWTGGEWARGLSIRRCSCPHWTRLGLDSCETVALLYSSCHCYHHCCHCHTSVLWNLLVPPEHHLALTACLSSTRCNRPVLG